jgi:aspartate/methionine/tyrosine aminotransferase
MPPRTPPAARRLEAVLRPVIPRVAALQRQRPDALSLAQGMVNWGPPAAVAEAVAAAVAEGGTGLDRYGPMAGDPALLELVRRELGGRRGLDLADCDLLVTAGSNMAFHAVVQVLCDPGDEVLLPLPWYFNHAMAIQLAGGVPVPVAAGPVADPEILAAAIGPRTRAIVTVSPNNPSGVVLPAAVLQAINRLCAERGLLHLSDEAYADFVFGPEAHHSPGSAAGSGAHTATFFSLSKSHGMAGWRIGYAAVPKALREPLAKVQDTVLICPPQLTQRAAAAALATGPGWVAERVATLSPRRTQLLQALAPAQAWGLAPLAVPEGAFYALVEAPWSAEEKTLLEHLVLRHGVAALPGGAFGLPAQPGRVALRLSYGLLDPAALAEALRRLVRAFRPGDSPSGI